MDFLKALLAYMATTLVVAVESTSTPPVTPVPTPAPTPAPGTAVVETTSGLPSLEETALPTATVSLTPAPVPTITPNLKGYHNLAQGDRGQEVKRLQERLIELGYLPEGSADGAYGGQTRLAVRRFQYFNGLTMDGIAGRATQTNLFENPDAAPYPDRETPVPEVETTPAAPEEEDETDEAEPAEKSQAQAEETAEPETAEQDGETPAPAARSAEEPEAEPKDEPEATEEPVAEPSEEPEATEEPAAEPAEEPEVTEEPAAEPSEEPEATEEPAAEPSEEPEATEEPTAEPSEDPEATEEPEETPAPTELTEDVDLDEQEATPTPAPTAEPVVIPYQDLAGWVALNESGDALQWTELEDGVPVVRSPRLQRYEEDIRISLDDLCSSVEGWTLTEDGNSLVLEAQGFVLALLNEDAGFVSMVDGLEMYTLPGDFDFGEGHFIRVDFLTRALDGVWEWDEEEDTLIIRIPPKNPALYND